MRINHEKIKLVKPKTVSKYVHVYVKEAVTLRDATEPSVPEADALTITLPVPLG